MFFSVIFNRLTVREGSNVQAVFIVLKKQWQVVSFVSGRLT